MRFLLGLVVAVSLFALTLFGTPAANAHAELRQSSPQAGETVGGTIHSIALQFFDLDVTKPQSVKAFDGAGNELDYQMNREEQRIVLALVEPITTPGEYLVTFAVNGIDGDFSEESFSFFYEAGAPEPQGITVDVSAPGGFDYVTFGLLLLAGGLAAFLVHRFRTALQEHRAMQLQ